MLILEEHDQDPFSLHLPFFERVLKATTANSTASITGTSSSSSSSNNMDWDLFNAIMSHILLFFLIFGLSATVDLRSLKQQLSNKFALGLGVTMQFLIMPMLGFVAVVSLRNHGLTQAMCISLLVVTTSPGGSFSNWWCSTFNAELALSVAMTSVSSLLSIVFLPLNLFLYTYFAYGVEESVVQELDFSSIFISLAVVLIAIVTGMYAGYRFDNERFHVNANRAGTISGLALIFFSLFLSSGADGADSNFWNQPWAFYVAVAFPCLVGMSLANIVSRSLRLSPPETVAIAIEICYQNTGIATSVAITMFDDVNERAQAIAVPLFYGLVEAVAIGIYCLWAWKVGWTKAPKNENICVVITKSYEIQDSKLSKEEEQGNDSDMEQGVAFEVDTDGNLIEQATSQEDEMPVKVVSTGFLARLFRRDRGATTSSSAAGDDIEGVQRKRLASDFTELSSSGSSTECSSPKSSDDSTPNDAGQSPPTLQDPAIAATTTSDDASDDDDNLASESSVERMEQE